MASKRKARKKTTPEAAPKRSRGRAPGSGKRGPTEPSRPTVKRLFAVSGNRCAFPKCTTPIVDRASGSIIGEICHIKGENDGAKRHDLDQSNHERHGFDNLILLCGTHHKVIDDDENAYTVTRLRSMKRRHEAKGSKEEKVTNAQAHQLIANLRSNSIKDGSIIQTQHQSGGQNAHVIHNVQNFNSPPPEDENVAVEGSLSLVGKGELLQAFGCPGLQLTVVCRSKRPAKIRKARVSVEGTGFLAALQQGWGVSFGHDPPKGLETETLSIKLARISPPNSPEGYSLNRDDVCRFYLPMDGPLGPFLIAPAQNVSVRVVFFDNSERVILSGELVQDTIRELVESFGQYQFSPKFPAVFTLNVKSAGRPPNLWPITGTTNPNPVSFVPPESQQEAVKVPSVRGQLFVVKIDGTSKLTLGALLLNVGPQQLAHVETAFAYSGDSGEIKEIRFSPLEQGGWQPGQPRHYLLPPENLEDLKRVVATVAPVRHGLQVRSGEEVLLRVPGEYVQAAVVHLQHLAAAGTRRDPSAREQGEPRP